MTDRPVTRRLSRGQRREQLVGAATEAFARAGGYPHTTLDDVAARAGVTAAIVYRHFGSKAELYSAAIDRACEGLYLAATGPEGEISETSLPRMLRWAAAEPDAFRLLFRSARFEPEFRGELDEVWASMVAHARPHVATLASSPAWTDWGAQLNTTVIVESILAWLDNGSPDPDEAAERIAHTVTGIERAVRGP